MKFSRFAIPILFTIVIAAPARAIEPAAETKFLVQVRLLEGDPQGSREAGTLRVLAEPMIATTSGRQSVLHSGGEKSLRNADSLGFVKFVPFGTRLEITPTAMNDGRVFVEMTAEVTTIGEDQESLVVSEGRIVRVQGTVKLGEVTKVQLVKNAGGKNTWVEFTVTKFKEDTPPDRPAQTTSLSPRRTRR